MGGLDDLLGGLVGGSSGGLGGLLGSLTSGGSASLAGGGGSLVTALLPMVGGMLAGGGLGKLLAGFEGQGLGSVASSWVGTGQNQPVTGAQVQQVVGADKVAEIASKLGVSHDQAAQAVAEVLPHVVDHLTPEGQLPAQEHVDAALQQLQQPPAATP